MKEKTIYATIVEMCLYWNVSGAHELKTLRNFKLITPDLDTHYLSHIKPEKLIDLYSLLRDKSNGTDESVKRQFEYVRRVFKYAHAKGYIPLNPCQLVKLPKTRKARVVSLSAQELEAVEGLPVAGRLGIVRDYFLFQCYTGLAYCDFSRFSRKWVVKSNGKLYLHGERSKTGNEFILPFTPKAKAIADRFNYTFPVIGINYYNTMLKDIQKMADLEINLTTHLARRTFGQTMIDAGIPLEVVSTMLGHSCTKMTEKHYARVRLTRVVRDMERLAA